MNRPDFLLRQLRYYRDLRFQGTICIGDSSNPFHVERTKKSIEGFQGDIDIVYREFLHHNVVECVQQLLDLITTPYAIWISDDDFLVPSSLDQCVRFLNSHPDYSAAHGAAMLINAKSNAAHGRVKSAGHFRQPEIEGDSASQRLTSLLRNYAVTHYSVHRTETWRSMYKNASLMADWKAFGGELLQCCISAIEGRIKELDCLTLVRQVYDARDASPETNDDLAGEAQAPVNMSASVTPDSFDWVTGEDWLPSYEIFRDCLSEELARQDRISLGKAREVVKQAFWPYLGQSLSLNWTAHHGQATSGSRRHLRSAVRAVPGTRLAWRTLRSFLPGANNEWSLQALLRPSSPYHADFMPIYRAVTSPTGSPPVSLTEKVSAHE